MKSTYKTTCVNLDDLAQHNPMDELKQKLGAAVRRAKAWFFLCLIGCFGFELPMNAQTADADNLSAAAQFKAYLASPPPAIEKFVFRRTSKSPTEKGGEETRVEFYHARWQTNGLFIRQLHQLGDMDQPHLQRMGVMLGLFAGRFDDSAWILTGDRATFMTPIRTNRDDHVANVQASAVSILHQALNLGVTKVRFGSFKWQGNEFEAPAMDGTTIRGSLIQTADGRPKQLKFIVNPDLFVLLDYSYTKKLELAFLPDKFSFTSVYKPNRFTNTVGQLEIYELKPSTTVLGEEYFKPDDYITPQNTKFIERRTNDHIAYYFDGKVIASDIIVSSAKSKTVNRSYLFLLLLPTMLLIAFFLYKQKQTNKNKTV